MTFTPIIVGSGFNGFQTLKTTEDAQRRAHSSSVEIAREREYALDQMGSISTSDQLLADRRLLEVALTAYGLEDQLDNRAFVKRVLDEGVEDEQAFANLLNDSRWVDFSRDMGFGPNGGGVSDIDGFAAIVENRFRNAEAAAAATPALDPFALRHFRDNVGSITSVDDLLNDTLTLDVALQAFGLERGYYTDDHFRQLLTEGVDDPANDYAYTLPESAWVSFATAFSGLADGQPLPSISSFRLDVERELERRDVAVIDASSASSSSQQLTTADLTQFQNAADAIGSATDLISDPQMRDVALAAYGLGGTTLSDAEIVSLLDSAVAGDFSQADAQSDTAWRQFADSFARSVNGGAATAVPQFAYRVELAIADSKLEPLDFLEPEDDSVSTVTADELFYFTTNIQNVDDVDAFLADDQLVNVGLAAFGLENSGRSTEFLRDILTEDVSDDSAFVNSLSDTRWKDFASAFQGVGAQQAEWQSEIEKRLIALDAPAEDLEFLRANWNDVNENLDLVLFEQLRDIALSAFGIPKGAFSAEFYTSMVISDPNDPNSFVNLFGDDNWSEAVSVLGSLANSGGNLSDEDYVLDVVNRFENRSFEIAVGEQDQNMRLALNFENTIASFAEATSWFTILGDQPLRTVLDAAFTTPEGFINLDIEDQAAWYERRSQQLFGDSTPAVFASVDVVDEALRRFLASVDTAATGGLSVTTPGYNAIGLMTNAAQNARTGFGTF